MDGVKVALGKRGMKVEAARQCAKDRKEWRALVHINWMSCTNAWPCVLSDLPSVHWWLSPVEGYDAVTWCSWDKLWKERNYVCDERKIVCVLSDSKWLLLLGGGRKSWYIITVMLLWMCVILYSLRMLYKNVSCSLLANNFTIRNGNTYMLYMQ